MLRHIILWLQPSSPLIQIINLLVELLSSIAQTNHWRDLVISRFLMIIAIIVIIIVIINIVIVIIIVIIIIIIIIVIIVVIIIN